MIGHRTNIISGLSLFTLWMNSSSTLGLHLPSPPSRPTQSSASVASDHAVPQSRRAVLATTFGGIAAGLVMSPSVSHAANDDADTPDLTSQMFNPDGSLKEGIESEAKERKVQLSWRATDNYRSIVDETIQDGDVDSTKGSDIRLSYDLPLKWSDGKNGDELYFDRSEGTNARACKRVTVYQPQGDVDLSMLQKASRFGVAKVLQVPQSLKRLYGADIISGRTTERNGQTYYEFDMAAAPETCGSSKENLGLGFCPYDNIFLLSATVVDSRLYVACVECDSTRIWKLASAELKRVRSSFTVEVV